MVQDDKLSHKNQALLIQIHKRGKKILRNINKSTIRLKDHSKTETIIILNNQKAG